MAYTLSQLILLFSERELKTFVDWLRNLIYVYIVV